VAFTVSRELLGQTSLDQPFAQERAILLSLEQNFSSQEITHRQLRSNSEDRFGLGRRRVALAQCA
jgi:hypothetical protein